MCTNQELVDSLECYLEEMLENFQDFIKKSLVVITVGVGSVIGILVYFLKGTSNQQGNAGNGTRVNTALLSNMDTSMSIGPDVMIPASNNMVSYNSLNDADTTRKRCCNTGCAKASTESMKISKDICPKCLTRPKVSTSPRVSIPSLPTGSYRPCEFPSITRSCCSLCCQDP